MPIPHDDTVYDDVLSKDEMVEALLETVREWSEEEMIRWIQDVLSGDYHCMSYAEVYDIYQEAFDMSQ